MTKHTLSAHAALTAIAAGLVLLSTPASAQVTDTAPADAAPAPDASIVVPNAQPAPAEPGPATAVTLPQISVPAPTPSAAAAPALPEVAPQRSVQAEPAPVRSAAPAESRATRSEPRAASVTRPAPETRTFTPAPADMPTSPSASTLPSVPLADPAVVREEAAPAPAPAVDATEPSGTDALWVVGGTGAALLVGVGALVFMRRRRHDEADSVAVARAPIVTQDADPIFATPGFAVAQPAPAPAAVARTADEPAVAELVLDAPVASPSPALTHTEHSDELEAMVAQAPSPENPFVTRSKRLRRAEFLLHNGHVPAANIADTPQVREESAPVKEKAPQPVYNFSSGPVSFRPKGWKPATT